MHDFDFNDHVCVSSASPHFAGRSGWLLFYGEGPSEGTAVIANKPEGTVLAAGEGMEVFAVGEEFISLA